MSQLLNLQHIFVIIYEYRISYQANVSAGSGFINGANKFLALTVVLGSCDGLFQHIFKLYRQKIKQLYLKEVR